MDRYVPLNKRTKKEQKNFHSVKRSTWGTFSPVTRTVQSGRVYDRNRIKQSDRRMDD